MSIGSFRFACLSAIALATLAWLSPGWAQVEYVKICDVYGDGFYYIPGTDTCIRIGGLVKNEDWTQSPLPPAFTAPPPAGCQNCQLLDRDISSYTAEFYGLQGKNPQRQEEIAGIIQRLRDAKAACQETCRRPVTGEPTEGGPCESYGEGFYYIPGSNCLRITGGVRDPWTESKPIPPGAKAPPQPAGCANCAKIDEELTKLRDQLKNPSSVPLSFRDFFVQDAKRRVSFLEKQKAACEKTCRPKTTKKPHEPRRVTHSASASRRTEQPRRPTQPATPRLPTPPGRDLVGPGGG